jgi:PiT family inorganic phosphate transporter
MTATFAFVLVLVTFALIFDYINGFHDAANSIATVVSSRVLSPALAVVWAAFFNFVAFAVFGTRVAKAIGDGVRMDLIAPEWRLYVLLGALIGAIIWNLITWYLGLPTSSSHALLGGYAGAGIAAYGGISGLLKTDVWLRTLKFIVLSPLIGMILGFTQKSIASFARANCFRRPRFRSATAVTMRRRQWALSPLY